METKSLWSDIVNYSKQVRYEPWVVLRDFNVIRSLDEKVEGAQ